MNVEPLITELHLHREDLSFADTGGAFRTVQVDITVDTSLPLHRQKISAVYELMAVYLQPVMDSDDVAELAEHVVDLLEELENA